MLSPAASPFAVSMPSPAAPDDPASSGVSFREVLSALNPLQYLPVVGTIYRAVTGDTVPEPLRIIGSVIAGGLMGGPIGLALSATSAAVQKVTGIDLDAIGHEVLVGLGVIGDDAPVATQTALAAYARTAQIDSGMAGGQG